MGSGLPFSFNGFVPLALEVCQLFADALDPLLETRDYIGDSGDHYISGKMGNE